jgi:hypothetical protein
MFNVLLCEVIVHFLDTGGIIDHHCLNFLFIFICHLDESKTKEEK